MATALDGWVDLIPFGQAFSTGTRLAFGWTVAPTENNAETPFVIRRLAPLLLAYQD